MRMYLHLNVIMYNRVPTGCGKHVALAIVAFHRRYVQEAPNGTINFLYSETCIRRNLNKAEICSM
jgi:hypothetical protein